LRVDPYAHGQPAAPAAVAKEQLAPVKLNKKCSESAFKKAQRNEDNDGGQKKPLPCSFVMMILLLTLALLSIFLHSPSGISRALLNSKKIKKKLS
jgi:hypothetical protein